MEESMREKIALFRYGLIAPLIKDGDTRWVHRSAYDLMDYQPGAHESRSRMPRARALYGSLPEQLADPDSFASRLTRILEIRRRHGIATAVQVDVPVVSHRGMLVMVHRLDDGADQLTVLNFSTEPISGSVISQHLTPGSSVTDLFTGDELGQVDDLRSLHVELAPHEGLALLARPPAPQD